MQIPIFQVDAFTDTLFSGNPAAVCPLERWLPDELMQNIAAENNLAETAFFTLTSNGYEIRWFTPTTEVDLCGHATLAAAAVMFDQLQVQGERICFSSRSGPISVTKVADGLQLDFPSQAPSVSTTAGDLSSILGFEAEQVLEATDLIAVAQNQQQLEQLNPNLNLISQLPYRGLIVTAPASGELDFVCRFFAPQSGIDEDPVTGSAYTELAPYWANRLDKSELTARQISKRGGSVHCQIAGDRVLISGQVKHYLQGVIQVPNSESQS